MPSLDSPNKNLGLLQKPRLTSHSYDLYLPDNSDFKSLESCLPEPTLNLSPINLQANDHGITPTLNTNDKKKVLLTADQLRGKLAYLARATNEKDPGSLNELAGRGPNNATELTSDDILKTLVGPSIKQARDIGANTKHLATVNKLINYNRVMAYLGSQIRPKQYGQALRVLKPRKVVKKRRQNREDATGFTNCIQNGNVGADECNKQLEQRLAYTVVEVDKQSPFQPKLLAKILPNLDNLLRLNTGQLNGCRLGRYTDGQGYRLGKGGKHLKFLSKKAKNYCFLLKFGTINLFF